MLVRRHNLRALDEAGRQAPAAPGTRKAGGKLFHLQLELFLLTIAAKIITKNLFTKIFFRGN